jgi:twitching motility protein PilT
LSQLLQILKYLDRDDITEVVIQTGRPPTVRMGGEYRPVGKNPVTTPQIEALLGGTPLEALLPAGDSGGAPQNVVITDRTYVARVARRGPALQLRVEAGWAKGDGSKTSAPRPPLDSTSVSTRLPEPPPSPLYSENSRTFQVPPDARPSSPQATSAPTPAPAAPAPRARPDAHRAVTRPVDVESLTGGSPGAGSPVMIGVPTGRTPGSVSSPPPAVISSPLAPQATPAPAPVARRQEPALSSGATGVTPGSFKALVADARARKASDMHIASDRPAMIRTAGELLTVGNPLPAAEVEKMLMALLSPEQKELLASRGYVDFALEIEGLGRLRANVSTQRGGYKGSFRMVMHPTPTLDSLGLPKELAKVTTYHQGLVVIAGPNGHGKTTTLAAIVNIINGSRPHHILTVEEPVEFLHTRKMALVSQREVGLHTRSFAAALKASLREDPDVIVIGELRDRETVEIAITAAETGHLVIATMSTPSAAKTIDRLIDLFPPEDQSQVRATLAGALKFIVAQRLLPSATGSEFVAAVELLTGVPALWALIRDNKLFQLPSLQQRGRAYGMIRFDDSLAELVRAGKITEEVALRYTENKKEFQNALHPPAATPSGAQPPPPAGGQPAAGAAGAAGAAAAKGLQDIKSRMGGLFGKKE